MKVFTYVIYIQVYKYAICMQVYHNYHVKLCKYIYIYICASEHEQHT